MVLGLVGLSSKSFGSIRFVPTGLTHFITSNVIEHQDKTRPVLLLFRHYTKLHWTFMPHWRRCMGAAWVASSAAHTPPPYPNDYPTGPRLFQGPEFA